MKVRLYRPFAIDAFVAALPRTVKAMAVLDRTKEPGAIGDPLWTGRGRRRCARLGAKAPQPLRRRRSLRPRVEGVQPGDGEGRVRRARAARAAEPLHGRHRRRRHAHGRSTVDAGFDVEVEDRTRAVFYGLGADGTVGANKNSIKIIGEETDHDAQGYYVYDSKKSGARHDLAPALRPVARSGRPTSIRRASFVACHQFSFLERYDMLEVAAPGAVFLLNSAYPADKVVGHAPAARCRTRSSRSSFASGSSTPARSRTRAGMGGRINVIMQTCFFAISGVLPRDEAIAKIKQRDREDVRREGRRRGGASATSPPSTRHWPSCTRSRCRREVTATAAPSADRQREGARLRPARHGGDARGQGRPAAGERVPRRRHLADRHRAVGEAQPRGPDPGLGRGDLHPVQQVRARLSARRDPRRRYIRRATLDGAPATFKSDRLSRQRVQGRQVHDPGRAGGLHRLQPVRDRLSRRRTRRTRGTRRSTCTRSRRCATPRSRTTTSSWRSPRSTGRPSRSDVKGPQFLQPLFEYSGACAGCGETPYLKLATQLFGDRMLMANATGCSSIYGGNLPTHAVHDERATGAARPGRTRSSRTTPSSASACASRSTASTHAGAELRKSPVVRHRRIRS